jgi:SWI/SNF-related matrix-associated actin-dependent regulator of chromatin subfamily A-like protein 1
MRYQSLTTSVDWFRVTWDADRSVPPAEWGPALAIPGIRYYPRAIEIPRTAWAMPQVLDLCAELGVTPPQHVEKYATIGIWLPWRKPLAHQWVVTKTLLAQQRVLLADTMGLGKTSSAILAAETVRRHIHHGKKPVLIVGPLRVRNIWLRELLAMGAIDSPSSFCALRSQDIDDSCWNDDAHYYFLHYDIVHVWWPKFTAVRPCVTIVDEAHYVKNSQSRRTRSTAMVAHTAPFRLLLTGTPVDNEPKDLYSLLDFLNGPQTWGTRSQFRVRYCGAVREQYGFVDTTPTNTTELRARMAPYYIRRELSDTDVQLPPFTRELAEVEMSDRRIASYRQHTRLLSPHDIQRLVDALISGAAVGNDVMRTMTELRQVTSEAKIAATCELASDILAADGAVVVFTWQRSTAQQLQRMLQGSRLAITGELANEKREHLIDSFQAEGGALVATYGALQDAVTLHRSRAVIMHDIDYLPKTMLQAEKRVHRIGQNFGTKSYWMVANQLFDRLLLAALRQKTADSELILSLREQIPELTSADSCADTFATDMERTMREWQQWKI